MKLQKETITIEIFHNNIHAYNAIYKAISDATLLGSDNYHVKTRVITAVESCKAK
mgnify:FL=1